MLLENTLEDCNLVVGWDIADGYIINALLDTAQRDDCMSFKLELIIGICDDDYIRMTILKGNFIVPNNIEWCVEYFDVE